MIYFSITHPTDRLHRIRPLGLVVKRITSIACYDKIASSILAEGTLFLLPQYVFHGIEVQLFASIVCSRKVHHSGARHVQLLLMTMRPLLTYHWW